MNEHLINLLSGKGAHLTFDEAIRDFPVHAINLRATNVPYTCWHLLEHMRIAQWDILEFVRDPAHVSPEYPTGYWPAPGVEASIDDWDQSIEQFRVDLESVKDLVRDPAADFLAELPHAPGYTLLREILLVADHNAFHTGELAILREVMSLWPERR